MRQKLKRLWQLLAKSGQQFMATDSFNKGAALSYYTVFALPPVLIILITIAGSMFGREAVKGRVYAELRDFVGPEGALEVQSMVETISKSTSVDITAVIGITTLLIAATGAFISMQDSLNAIWCVKPKPRNQFLKLFRDRFLSFTLILGITLLLLLSLATNAILVALGPYLDQVFSGTMVYYFIHAGNALVMLGILTLLFASIYKFLPDAIIGWSDVWVGGLVTAILFSIGRSLIGLYLGTSNPASIYGAAGTIVLILIWVFYSSQILFFGAVFTRQYAVKYGRDIFPSEYAVRVVNQEIELGKTSVNEDTDPLPVKEIKPPTDPYSCSDEPKHLDVEEDLEGGKPF